MPNEVTRITPRKVVDSSLSANIPLQVQASQDHWRSAGSSAFVLGDALNKFATIGRQAADDKYKVDVKKGAEAAQDQAVTGTDMTSKLAAASEGFTKGYQETQGVLAAQKFTQFALPKMATLEPDANIDEHMQGWLDEYMKDAPESHTAREAMMAGLRRQEVGLKTRWTQQSVHELLKRQDENVGAIITESITDGSLFNKGGMKAVQDFASRPEIAMKRGELQRVTVNALAASMATGDVPIDKAMEFLKRKRGDQPASIYDIPEYKSVIDNAAKAGLRVQAQKAKAAQWGDEEHAIEQGNALVDRGQLPKGWGKLHGKAFGWSPGYSASWDDKNRAAQERLAKAAATKSDKLDIWGAFIKGDATGLALAGTKANKVINDHLIEAYRNGDAKTMSAIITQATVMRQPLPYLTNVFNGFDASNPKQAERLIGIAATLKASSPAYAERIIPPAVRAQIDHYHHLMDDQGASSSEALATIHSTQPVEDTTASTAVIHAASKDDPDLIPMTFDDGGFFHDATPIGNGAQIKAEVLKKAAELQATGHYGPDGAGATKAAQKMVMAHRVRVGNVLVPAHSVLPTDGVAITAIQQGLKDHLVTAGTIAKDDPVFLAPDPTDPGKWDLLHADGNNTMVLQKANVNAGIEGAKPKIEEVPVQIDIHKALHNYTPWKMKQDDVTEARIAEMKRLHSKQLPQKIERSAASVSPPLYTNPAPTDVSDADINAYLKKHKDQKDRKGSYAYNLSIVQQKFPESSFVDYFKEQNKAEHDAAQKPSK